MFELSMQTLAIAFVVVCLGAILQTLSGFGMALLAAPVLVLIDSEFLPAPILTLGFVLSLFNATRLRAHLDIAPIGYALVTRAIGSVLAIGLLSIMPIDWLITGFAVLIIATVALTVKTVNIQYSRRNMMIAGFLSGVIGTTTSIGGPPVAMVLQNSPLQQARAQLSLFFLISTFMSLILLSATGNFSAHQLELTVFLLPALVVGFVCANAMSARFKPQYFKPVINIVSVMASLFLLAKTWVI